MKLIAQQFAAQEVRAQEAHSWFHPPGGTAPGRVFHAFDGWALVPAADLLMLRHAIERSGAELPGAELREAEAILRSVEQELVRRSQSCPRLGDDIVCSCTPSCSCGLRRTHPMAAATGGPVPVLGDRPTGQLSSQPS